VPVLITEKREVLSLLRERPIVELSHGDRKALRVWFKLSPREVQIIRQLMRSFRETEIAALLEISTHTVHTHVGRIYRKLNVTSVAELALRIVSVTRAVSRNS
jgi:DNA-binding CsgD family transcriptional regulator